MTHHSARSVAIYMHDLAGGGAERQVLRLARQFQRQRLDVTLLLHADTGDLRADLQVTAFRAGEVALDFETNLTLEQRTGGARRDQGAATQRVCMYAGEGDHVLLAAVVCDQCDGFHGFGSVLRVDAFTLGRPEKP